MSENLATVMPPEGIPREAFHTRNVTPAAFDDLAGDDKINVFMEIMLRAKAMEAQAKAAFAYLEACHSSLVEYFQEQGQQRVTRGGKTLYIARELWPVVLDDGLEGDDTAAAARERLVEALKLDPTTEHLVNETYNHQTLRSFILNDCEQDDALMPVLPEHLQGKLGVVEKFRPKIVNG